MFSVQGLSNYCGLWIVEKMYFLRQLLTIFLHGEGVGYTHDIVCIHFWMPQRMPITVSRHDQQQKRRIRAS